MWREPGEFTYYFGAWDVPGHHLWTPSRLRLYPTNKTSTRLPMDTDLDGSYMFLPRPESPSIGAITYVQNVHLQYTVLAWWDRTFDSRPGSCCAIVTGGRVMYEEAWERFSYYYPELSTKLSTPVLIEGAPRET